jgi:Large-conductance mechanosensitive channel
VKSAVDDVLMPPIGLLLGGVDFSDFFVVLKEGAKAAAPYHNLADAKAAGSVTLNFGLFVNAIISFTIVAFALFMLVKGMNRLRANEAPKPVSTKKCPHCCSDIAIEATRCPHCTSEL